MKRKIIGLDGLRGIAVILVIMSHAVMWDLFGVTNTTIRTIFSAHAGVSMFFVLSGFLITLLLLNERNSNGQISIRNFIIRRAIRIFPLYYLSIFFLYVMHSIGATEIKDCTFLYALTYTVNLEHRNCSYASTSHFWSLSVEEHFYLLWPILFFIGPRIAFAIAVAVATACLYFGTQILPSSENYYPDRWTFPAMLPILIGCITAFIANSKFISTLLKDKTNSNLLLISIITGLCTPAFLGSEAAWLISAASLILYIYHRQDSMLTKALEFRPLAYIGLISYGLYVWQGIFTGNGPYRIGTSFPPELYTGVVLTFIAAPLSYIFFEKPILSLKNKFSWMERSPSEVRQRTMKESSLADLPHHSANEQMRHRVTPLHPEKQH
ncbi:acyltransferase family protein [Pseudomonas sp. GCM10022186]|uniref:acyltransferase family protein n=1 Tax=Pseudomonas sp. GCM10022186 TaxID=3252650 RepID=UPI0036096CD7